MKALGSIRFGYGLAAGQPMQTAQDLMAQLDRVAPVDGLSITARRALLGAYQDARKAERAGKSGAAAKRLSGRIRDVLADDHKQELSRQVLSGDGFVERLVVFWADHFTVSARNRTVALARGDYIANAIRPNIAGDFADLLIAAVTHPAMLIYLDQNSSIGPNSKMGQQKGRGLNENLAREVLELHTLGVSGGYSQKDVTEFAELLTGLRLTSDGVEYKPWYAEPGAEVVLGRSYGGKRGRLEDLHAALHDIAIRPETAAHLAWKLAVHFVDDRPDQGLIDHIATAYLKSGGNLRASYAALLEHPAAWATALRKVKRPRDYVVSALRGMGLGEEIAGLSVKELRQGLLKPMEAMGQSPGKPRGPDGWPEEGSAWITPATLAARIAWATELANRFGVDRDPRAFLDDVLGDVASAQTRALVGGSESKWEGVALVLASPEFNRR